MSNSVWDSCEHWRNFRGTGPNPHFLEWEDGPPFYKYIKSEILLGLPHFSDESYATGCEGVAF